MQIRQRDEVDLDLTELTTWYERRRVGLGDVFLREFQRAVDRIADNPLAWPPLRAQFRKYLIREFDVLIVYGVVEDGIELLVVTDARRSPESWRQRLID
jgi:hypothetical protein